MNETKAWYQSTGIWGSLIVMLAGVISAVSGHVLTPEDQTYLTATALNLVNVISTVVTVIGGLVAWYGRWKATKIIV